MRLATALKTLGNLSPQASVNLILNKDLTFDEKFGKMSDDNLAMRYATMSDDEKVSQANFDVSKILWETIANMPKADRRSSAIDAAIWEAFAKDYIAVMPAVTGKTVENCTNATLVYMKKFSQVKANKKVLAQLKDQLALYANTSKDAENFEEILSLLNDKCDAYLKSNDVEQLIANL